MNWLIPAKTFLLGEYAALAGDSALILNTLPGFSLTLTDKPGLQGIHPDSPAGVWWRQQRHTFGLIWEDPYQGLGGLGASSAQFVGVYKASMQLSGTSFIRENLLDAYYESAWQGVGIRPSGYDVLAQSFEQGCVVINRNQNILQPFSWPFKDLGVLLLHTGFKLATHEHLQKAALPQNIKELARCSDWGRRAFEGNNPAEFIRAVHAFQLELIEAKLVAYETLLALKTFSDDPDILAAKGCGAMGADIILLLMNKDKISRKKQFLQDLGWNVVGEV